MIQDGELLILGGLIEGGADESDSKVPFLGDIPILGNLFKSSGKSDREKVLMMFIRPTIIRNPLDAKALSDSKFDHLITRDFDGVGKESIVTQQLKNFIEESTVKTTAKTTE
jgi:general secretion pathway protein D